MRVDQGTTPTSAEGLRFGPFCLLPRQRVLLDDDVPVRLGSRALEILLLLVERAGQFVGNDEIVARVWPKVVVVEGNLRVHIAELRKALGDRRDGHRYIVNVPNRGYSFIATVSRGPAPQRPADAPRPRTAHGLPAPLNRVIGRDQAVEALSEQVKQHRLVTLVGAGGIGKTTIALTVAAAFAQAAAQRRFAGVFFADLASLADARLVASTLASALGLGAPVDGAMPSLLTFLHDKQLLLLFDNCEHVVEAVAEIAEGILRSAAGVHILATSREPLRAEGEWIQRLQALDLPPTSRGLTARQALAFPAVELFVERASAALDNFVLHDADVVVAIDICRRLDGIPLAIELAAARVDPYGVRGVAAALDDCFSLLSKGRRTALPRHQTLRATLDWSFGLLSPRDRTILLRLAVFAGSFTLESACAVAAWDGLTNADVLEGVSDLVDKSLVAADMSGDEVFFRQLDTTRAYAAERLAQSEDAAAMRRRHAEHCAALLQRAAAEWQSAPTHTWLHTYGRRIDDVRAAMAWAFSDDGDIGLGVSITVRAAPLFFQLSLSEEQRQHAERALQAVTLAGGIEPKLEFELRIVYGHMLFNTRGLRPETDQAFKRSLQIAVEVGDPGMLALAYSTCWMGAYQRGEPALMLDYAQKFEALTASQGDPAFSLMYDRMKAPALHFLSKQSESRLCCERSLAESSMVRPPFLSGSQIDRRVSVGTILGRVLWLQGLPEQAEQAASQSIDVAVREGEAVALAFTLAFCACPLALWSGQFILARERIAWLVRHTRERLLLSWHKYGLAYQSLLSWLETGAAGLPPLQEGPPPQLIELLATLSPAHASEAAFARGEAGLAGWCGAELLRLRGEQLFAADPQAARELLLRSLALAERDGALVWELRTSTSLVRVSFGTRDEAKAVEQLGSVLNRVTEGFATPDVRAAADLYRQATGTGHPGVQK